MVGVVVVFVSSWRRHLCYHRTVQCMFRYATWRPRGRNAGSPGCLFHLFVRSLHRRLPPVPAFPVLARVRCGASCHVMCKWPTWKRRETDDKQGDMNRSSAVSKVRSGSRRVLTSHASVGRAGPGLHCCEWPRASGDYCDSFTTTTTTTTTQEESVAGFQRLPRDRRFWPEATSTQRTASETRWGHAQNLMNPNTSDFFGAQPMQCVRDVARSWPNLGSIALGTAVSNPIFCCSLHVRPSRSSPRA